MSVLRTPDQHFEGLPDYTFAPEYAEVPGISVDQPCACTMWMRARATQRRY